MSTLTDIANWVALDQLNRPDLLASGVVQAIAVDTYSMICASVPFEELQATSQEVNLIANQESYTLGVTPFVITPSIRAIANLRITFDSSNKRRLRRSHVRVYDALSISPPSRPSTYARWDNQLQFNPPPDSSAYTVRFRYWQRPVIGLAAGVVTAATYSSPNATYTIGTHSMLAGDIVTIQGINPTGFNVVRKAIASVTATTITVAVGTNSPGTYSSGGLATDNSAQWNTVLLTPLEWDQLMRWESLYTTYYALNMPEKAAQLVQPAMMPRQASPRKQKMFEVGMLPRLWNDLLATIGQKEGVDEDFNVNPVIRPYSIRT